MRTSTDTHLPAVAAEVDAALVEISGAFDHLVAITPVDVEAARTAFRAKGCRGAPVFTYRPVAIDTAALRSRLDRLPIAAVDDPALRTLFEAKHRELDGQIRLIEQRNTPAFLDTALELYGGVEPELVATAEAILDRARTAGGNGGMAVGAAAFARRAEAEIGRYRSQWPLVQATVEVRDDLPGILVSGDRVLVGRGLALDPGRVEALVHHEVGTHVLTHENGRVQPLGLLRVGLPGAEETQEGLAVLAEFLVGGLNAARLALLSARVVAVDRLLGGEPFPATFSYLHHRHRFPPGPAFRVVMRVYRAGGLTKDAIYLRGLERLLSHLATGGALDPLLVGKLDLLHVPVIEGLAGCGLLAPVPLSPRWLAHPRAAGNLARIRAGLGLDQLAAAVCG